MEYRDLNAAFTAWSKMNGLIFNTSKTKEIIVDYCKRKTLHNPIVIDGNRIEIIQSYKYLDNKLDWPVHTYMVKLKSFNVCKEVLQIFFIILLQ